MSAPVTAEQVRESISKARTLGEQFFSHIVWQIENRAWEALGYADWDEMREAEYADMKGIIAPRQDRPELVTRMRQAGMTQRAIAANLGVTQQTVSNDLNTNTGNQRQPATITNARGQERPASYQRPTITRTETHQVTETIDAETGEIFNPKSPVAPPLSTDREPHLDEAAESPVAGRVVGLDGKTYSRRTASAPKRRPLPDQAHDAAANLTAALERVERIFTDDRFTQNREQVGEVTRAHLLRTAQVCQHLAEQLPS